MDRDVTQKAEAVVSDERQKSLAICKPDTTVVIEALNVPAADSIRLRRMGLSLGRSIRVVQVGDPLVVIASGARIGVSRLLARGVLVSELAS